MELLPVRKSSISSAENSGGSDAALRSESRRLRIAGDNKDVDSRSPSTALARDVVSGSDGVGTTEASLNSLS